MLPQYVDAVPAANGCISPKVRPAAGSSTSAAASSAQEPEREEPPQAALTSPRTLVRYAQAILDAPPVALLEARLLAHRLDDAKLQHFLWLLDTL